MTPSHEKPAGLCVLDTPVDDIEALDVGFESVSDPSHGWVDHWGRRFTREDVVALICSCSNRMRSAARI